MYLCVKIESSLSLVHGNIFCFRNLVACLAYDIVIPLIAYRVSYHLYEVIHLQERQFILNITKFVKTSNLAK